MIRISDGKTVKAYFLQRFGIPSSVFDGFSFFESSKSFYVSSAPEASRYRGLRKIEFAGLRVLRRLKTRLKPTTYILQIFGDKALYNVVDLTREELFLLLRGTMLKRVPHVEEGYVILRYQKRVIGCGLYREGRLVHQFPRGRTEALVRSEFY